jgi:carbohydrate diacid regulator
MVFSESLGREINNYIKTLLDRDATVLDEQKNIICGPTLNPEGKGYVPMGSFDELTTPKTVEVNGEKKLIIPLRYQVKNVAYLLMHEKSEELKNYSSLIKSFSELLIQQFYENNKPNLDSTDQFMVKLFSDYSPSNEKIFESEAQVLGYDLSVKRLAIAVHLDGFWEKCLLDFDQPSFERDQVINNWKRNIEQSFNSFFTKNADLIIAYIGNDRFVIFKGIEEGGEDNLRKLLKKTYKSIFEPLRSHRIKNITVGFGNGYSGINGLISAKREAELTLELGQRIWGGNQSYYFGDLGILSILGEGDREKKLTFANQILQKLRSQELLKTLECFFEQNLNLTETAEVMGIHRNTVIYRLNQITKTLNADPRIFEQAMSIKIALMIKSLFG